jgi:hypothetical protein
LKRYFSSYRGSRLSIDAIKTRKSPLNFGGIGLNEPLKMKKMISRIFSKIFIITEQFS